MRDIPIALVSEYESPTSRIAEGIVFTRQDEEVFAYCNHDRDITVDGVLYRRTLGVGISDVENSDDLSVGNFEARGALSQFGITESDVLAGRWDRAYWERRQFNWALPGAGSVVILTGYTGQVSLGRNKFTVELLDLLEHYQTTIIDLISAKCRATLGDEWCRVDLGPFTVTGSLEVADDPTWSVSDSTRTEAGGWFDRGKFTFTSGYNTGISREVKAFAAGLFIFQLPFPFPMMAGDAYEAVAGCDGVKGTCKDKFDNIVNRQAEDDVAGEDKMIQVGRST